MNILFCSVGRRGELIKDFKSSLGKSSKIVATDCSNTAPALYLADKKYIVPKITDEKYIDIILEICINEEISAITTFIDPEIELLSSNRDRFESIGVEVFLPYLETAKLCYDKFEFFRYLQRKDIKTVNTYISLESFEEDKSKGKIDFPVFVKPRTGSGSVGARKVSSIKELEYIYNKEENLIIQEFMDCEDLDVDVYIDIISNKAVSAFIKRKLETKIGGANKTVSFKDEKLFEEIQRIVSHFRFNGPIDMDFFYKDGNYYLSEINPRFGGAYLHAYGCGVDFIKLMVNNINGIENQPNFGNYDEDILMMMYDSVIIVDGKDMKI